MFILVEGKDLGFLKSFHAKLYPDAETQLDAIPNISIGEWGAPKRSTPRRYRQNCAPASRVCRKQHPSRRRRTGSSGEQPAVFEVTTPDKVLDEALCCALRIDVT